MSVVIKIMNNNSSQAAVDYNEKKIDEWESKQKETKENESLATQKNDNNTAEKKSSKSKSENKNNKLDISSSKQIDYNQKKNIDGRAELLSVENFDLLSPEHKKDKNHIKNYFNLISSLNTRTKRKIAHIAISAKGESKSFEELNKIAKQYLEYMGYGKSPYVIYGHNDTKNNHVHIVVSRISKEGKFIDDSNERFRTKNFIQQELGVNYTKQFDSKQFTDYSYANLNQFKLLLEQSGFYVKTENNRFSVYSNSEKVGSLEKNLVTDKFNKYDEGLDDRLKQIKQQFKKYKEGRDTDLFISDLRKMFGYQVILHYPKDRDKKLLKKTNLKENHINDLVKPYGYTVINHHKKEIYKGSQILPLSFVINNMPEEQLKLNADLILNDLLLNKNISLYDLNKELRKNDLSVIYNGNVYSKILDKDIFKLEKGTIKSLLYNNKLHMLNQYTIDKDTSLQILSNMYKVNINDLQRHFYFKNVEQGLVNNILDDILKIKMYPKSKLDELKISIVKDNNKYYIQDFGRKMFAEIPVEYHALIESYTEKIHTEMKDEMISKGKDLLEKELSSAENAELRREKPSSSSFNIGGGEDEDEAMKKKKKKRRKRGNKRGNNLNR